AAAHHPVAIATAETVACGDRLGLQERKEAFLSDKPRNLGDILQEFRQHRMVMQQELQKIIVGQDLVIEQLFAAIFTRGHCLLEGVPGLAKTLMVSTLS